MPTPNDIARTYDAVLHCSIAGWAVSAVVGGLIVTTGWRY